MRRTGPDDRRAHESPSMPPAAEWVRDNVVAIGYNARTLAPALYVFRSFAYTAEGTPFWLVEAWAVWAVDDPDRPLPLLTLIQRQDGMSPYLTENDAIEQVRRMCRAANPDHITPEA